jgi:hypothetical protein
MKNTIKILVMALCFGSITAVVSCSKDDENCPSQTFDTLAKCEEATDGMKCICVPEGNGYKAILNP